MSFSCKILVREHESMQQKITMSYFLPDSPKPFQRNHSYFQDPGTKHDAHDNGVCSVYNLSRLESQPQPGYYLAESGKL